MLATMRSTAHSFFAKALLMFLVLTFAIWGVGDVLRSSHTNYVASIGHDKISLPEFERTLVMTKRQMQSMGLGKVDTDALEGQLLRQIIMQRLTGYRMHEIGLSVGDTLLVDQLRHAPALQKPTGGFDKMRFAAFLQQQNLSEQGFEARLRDDITAQTMEESLNVTDMALPASLTALQAMAAGETRDVALVTIPAGSVSAKAPSEQELKDYYDRQKDQLYVEPEKRTLDYAVIPASALAALVDKHITDQSLQERFDSEKASLGTAETRSVKQLLVTDPADADKVKAAITPGATLANAAKAAPKAKLTDLGAIDKNKLPQDAASAVFAAKQGDIVGPYQTDFGTSFYQVTSVTPGKLADFATVKPKLRDEMREETRDNTLQELSNQVEDALAAGKTLGDALKAAGLDAQLHTLSDVRSTDAKDKSPIETAVITQGYNLGEGEISGLEMAKDGTYFIVTDKSVTQSAPKAYAEVKDDVAKRLSAQTQQEAVMNKATTLLVALKKGGSDWQKVLEAQHVGSRTVGGIGRDGKSTGGLPAPLAEAVFQHMPGDVAGPMMLPNGDAALAIITTVHHNPGTQVTPEARKQFLQQFNNEILEAYFQSVEAHHHVHVNREVMANAQKETADD